MIEEIGDAIGPDLRGQALRAGDRVTWTEYSYCAVLDTPQKCVNIRKYGHERSGVAPHFLGGFAEYCYVLARTGIVRIPDDMSDEEAAPVMCGVPTMVSATESVSIGIGDAVVIQGLGSSASMASP